MPSNSREQSTTDKSKRDSDKDQPDGRDDTGTSKTGGVDPEDSAKPDSPDDLTKRSWKYVARKTLREFGDDKCTDLAAGLTYYAVLALFPAALALLSLVGLVGQSQQTVDTLLKVLTDMGAGSIADTLKPTLTQLSQAPGAGFALIAGLAGALWSASGYVTSFGRAMNEVYEIDEGRPVWKLRPQMLLITLVFVILVALVALALVLSGPAADAVGSAIGLGSTPILIWSIAKWPVLLAVIVLIVALLYYFTPNVKQPKFRWISIGALVAVLVWIVGTALFGFYIANFSSYNKTYGSMAGAVVFLLWLWITNLALLFGAELDAELERGRQLQAGVEAEKDIQLPARDTTNIEKTAAKEDEDIKRGRRIRQTAGQDDDPEHG